MRILHTIVFLAFLFTASAQDTLMVIFGQVTEVLSGAAVHPVSIEVRDVNDSSKVFSVQNRHDGRYEVTLHEPGGYAIAFSAAGHASKHIEVKLEGPTEEQWEQGYAMQVDLSMFRQVEGVELEMEEPVGKGVYDPDSDVFIWDREHGRAVSGMQKRMLKEYKGGISK